MFRFCFVSFLCVLLFFCSCKKDNSADSSYAGGIGLPDCKILTENSNYGTSGQVYTRKYSYFGNGQLSSIDVNDNTGTQPENYYFKYNSRGQLMSESWLIEKREEEFQFFTYDYKGRLSVIARAPDSTNSARYDEVFVYDSSGRVIRDTIYGYNSRVVTKYSSYRYDASRNVVCMTTYNRGNSFDDSTVYEYDNKKNAYLSFPNYIFEREDASEWGMNNPTKETMYFAGGEVSVDYFTYKYNSQGYPSKKVDTHDNVNNVTFDFSYKCY